MHQEAASWDPSAKLFGGGEERVDDACVEELGDLCHGREPGLERSASQGSQFRFGVEVHVGGHRQRVFNCQSVAVEKRAEHAVRELARPGEDRVESCGEVEAGVAGRSCVEPIAAA